MAPVDLPYLWVLTKRGRQFAYYRRAGRLTRLPAFDNPNFLAAYQAAHADAESRRAPAPTPRQAPAEGSLAALIAAYRASPAWAGLAPATKLDYDKGLEPLHDRFGHLPVVTMPRAFVKRIQDEYARQERVVDGKTVSVPTPRRANRVVAVLSLLLTWGVDRGWRHDNPALRPGRLATGPGYRAWTDAEVAAFLAAAPEPLRRAAALGLYTGQRKQDCLAMTRAARGGGAIEVVQAKTGARVWIPEHPELTSALDAAPRSDALTLLTRPDGHPWRENHFNHLFATAIKAAGLSGVSFHGLRKTAASRLAEAGASASEIAAITGHRTLSEVTRYTAGADQKHRATAAMTKLRERVKNRE